MLIYYDLSSVECPKCHDDDNYNGNDIEVLGKHVFSDCNTMPSLYDFICYKCEQIFTLQILLPLKRI